MMCPRFLLIFSSLLLRFCSAQTSYQSYDFNRNNLGAQQCPTWLYRDEKSEKCRCFNNRFKCTDDGIYLKAGNCATYDNYTGIVSYAHCPYLIQSDGLNMTKFDEQKEVWYILLPENVSELNDYFCGTMDRRGRVCSKCKDGFGPGVMSIGFQIQCSKCIGVWYGIPLYLFLELFPITIFYFILLIFQINITSAPMTGWACVELHDRNFRPIVWLRKPFHRCIVCLRRGWNTQSDIIEVFASFFLLSFTKCLYQVLLFMTSQPILHTTLQDIYLGNSLVLNVDMNITYGSKEHLIFAIPAVSVSCIVILLPTLILLFYPFRLFRACLTKCKLNGLALYTFVEKFYGCYRNSLDGGKDMRSFAALHFLLRIMLFGISLLGGLLMISNNDPFFGRNVLFSSILISVSLCRPYKKMYMNVLDVLLLAHLGLVCHLISSFEGFEDQSRFIFIFIGMVSLPFISFILIIMVRALRSLTQTHVFKVGIQKFKQQFLSSSAEQARVLVESTASEIDYGATH